MRRDGDIPALALVLADDHVIAARRVSTASDKSFFAAGEPSRRCLVEPGSFRTVRSHVTKT
jgi:hypothetical protein